MTRLLSSCDRRSTTGRRDYAILVLLARLGLRAGEVAGLTLDDVDWHHGELLVRGKADRYERLPLPVDVGPASRWSARTGCATAPPPACCEAGRRWPKSVRYCATAVWP